MEPDKATETNAAAIAPQETVTTSPDDAEARFAQLEAEKENYRKAYLKEAAKSKPNAEDFDEDDKMAEVAKRVLAESRLAEIAREQDTLIKTVLKENKELKLAHSNKNNTPPATTGSSTETTSVVRDSSISPDQLAYFKSKGWDDKKIAIYKKNLAKRA
jgi:hypothetical protein